MRPAAQRIKGFFLLLSHLSEAAPSSGLPMIMPQAIMDSRAPVSSREKP